MFSRSSILFIFFSAAVLVAGCEKSEVSVDVHGVNYSGSEFFYSLEDPTSPNRSAAGEHIDPFAAGGTTCCFTLPKRWRPGIKVEVFTRHWLPQRPDGTLPQVDKTQVVEVPPYVDGAPGELWVVRSADGEISVVSSNFQPDHPKWPGKVKGWPVPSLEYRRERWEILRKHEEGGVRLFASLLADLEKSPKSHAQESWDYAKERDPKSIEGFSGPHDPKFIASLRKEYEEGLERSKKWLQNVMDAKP